MLGDVGLLRPHVVAVVDSIEVHSRLSHHIGGTLVVSMGLWVVVSG